MIGTLSTCNRTVPANSLFEHVAIFNKSGASIPLESSMLKISSHVTISRGLGPSRDRNSNDQLGNGCGLSDLLVNFKAVCVRDGVDISQISSTKIWMSAWKRKVDKPKFGDLYWKLILGKVVAGDHWLNEKADCPICLTTQLAEHLFWVCPVAQLVWKRLHNPKTRDLPSS